MELVRALVKFGFGQIVAPAKTVSTKEGDDLPTQYAAWYPTLAETFPIRVIHGNYNDALLVLRSQLTVFGNSSCNCCAAMLVQNPRYVYWLYHYGFDGWDFRHGQRFTTMSEEFLRVMMSITDGVLFQHMLYRPYIASTFMQNATTLVLNRSAVIGGRVGGYNMSTVALARSFTSKMHAVSVVELIANEWKLQDEATKRIQPPRSARSMAFHVFQESNGELSARFVFTKFPFSDAPLSTYFSSLFGAVLGSSSLPALPGFTTRAYAVDLLGCDDDSMVTATTHSSDSPAIGVPMDDISRLLGLVSTACWSTPQKSPGPSMNVPICQSFDLLRVYGWPAASVREWPAWLVSSMKDVMGLLAQNPFVNKATCNRVFAEFMELSATISVDRTLYLQSIIIMLLDYVVAYGRSTRLYRNWRLERNILEYVPLAATENVPLTESCLAPVNWSTRIALNTPTTINVIYDCSVRRNYHSPALPTTIAFNDYQCAMPGCDAICRLLTLFAHNSDILVTENMLLEITRDYAWKYRLEVRSRDDLRGQFEYGIVHPYLLSYMFRRLGHEVLLIESPRLPYNLREYIALLKVCHIPKQHRVLMHTVGGYVMFEFDFPKAAVDGNGRFVTIFHVQANPFACTALESQIHGNGFSSLNSFYCDCIQICMMTMDTARNCHKACTARDFEDRLRQCHSLMYLDCWDL